MSTTPAVVLERVEVKLGGRRILGPIDLSVERGEHVLLVGPSGCGKTTLLRCVAGLQRLAAGRVHVLGALATDGSKLHVAPDRRRVGFLFQGGALWPHMSVARTLDFVLNCRGVARRDRPARIGALLESVELTGLDTRLAATLSGGEAQRLALARALASEPEILLLDEPLGPLDAELRTALLARIEEVQRRAGLTALHVTHDPGEAEHLATRVVRLDSGAPAVARAQP